MHTCTCTTVSERKSPWHLVGSLVSQTDETTPMYFVGNRHVGVGRGCVRRRLGLLRRTASPRHFYPRCRSFHSYKCIARSYAGVVTAEGALSTDSLLQLCESAISSLTYMMMQWAVLEVSGEYLVGAARRARAAALVFSKEIGPRSLTSVASLCTAILPAQNVCWSVVAR